MFYISYLFDDLLNDIALEAPLVVKGKAYEKGYYLVNVIYPQWSSLSKEFKKLQEKTVNELSEILKEQEFVVSEFNELCVSPQPDLQYLSPYKGDSDYELDSGSSLFQGGEDDADAANERVNVTNTLGAYFSTINFGGGLG
ncbi:RNA-directed DNA polymerase [Tanacetum coccineum]|uniref:RNA-directed DNA polymerase n=1 Tax=Tanacetum coccineum TaxID=301880 RepID=A0ABQ4ZAK9_9ASTR